MKRYLECQPCQLDNPRKQTCKDYVGDTLLTNLRCAQRNHGLIWSNKLRLSTWWKFIKVRSRQGKIITISYGHVTYMKRNYTDKRLARPTQKWKGNDANVGWSNVIDLWPWHWKIKWEKFKYEKSIYGSIKHGRNSFKSQAKSKQTGDYQTHVKYMTTGYKKCRIISFTKSVELSHFVWNLFMAPYLSYFEYTK